MKLSSFRDFPAALRPSATRVSYEAGAHVFRTGAPALAVYYLEAGAVRLVRFGRAGEEVVLHDARAGEFFAEASLDSARYHCDAVASLPSTLLRIPSRALRELIEADPTFAVQWVSLLASQLRSVRTRVERLSLKGAAERVRHLLVSEGRGERCELVLPGTLKDLARDLGLTHEVLYRTLAALQREGVLERQGTSLRLAK